MRGTDFVFEDGIKKWIFRDDDAFMIKYSELRKKIFKDKEVINANGLQDRAKLVERFVLPLIKTSAVYIPEDYNAIEVNDIGNQVNSAHIDIVQVTNTHFRATMSYLAALEDIKAKIDEYLD